MAGPQTEFARKALEKYTLTIRNKFPGWEVDPERSSFYEESETAIIVVRVGAREKTLVFTDGQLVHSEQLESELD